MSVIVSSKYQIVIPREIRDAMNIRPGQEMEVFFLDGVMHVVPVLPVEALLGICPGMDTTVERDPDRV